MLRHNKSSHPVLQQFDIKIDQQTDLAAGEFEVGKYLGLVDRRKLLDDFEFHDDLLFNQ
jgi:hypothetical protein